MMNRKTKEMIMKRGMQMSLILLLTLLAGVIFVVVIKGSKALTLSMIIDTPKGGYYLGGEGGIANAIAGS